MINKKTLALYPAIVTLVFSLILMTIYTNGTLDGKFDHFMMPSAKWGIPNDLRLKGITPMYDGSHDGWDGQFYYNIANDVFNQKDTLMHLNGLDAYHYQRIGLPFLAKALSLVLGFDWVPPWVYYLTMLLLVVLASYFGALLFVSNNWSPWVILFWSLALGTQLTLLNGLMDSSADAMVILALSLYLLKVPGNRIFYLVFMSFATITREIYVLIPMTIFSFIFFSAISKSSKHLKFWQNRDLFLDGLSQLVPLIVFGLLHLVLIWNFPLSYSKKPIEIIDWPFISWSKHLYAGLKGSYPNVPPGITSFYFTINQIIFMALIVAVIIFAIKIRNFKLEKSLSKPIVWAFACIAIIYCCLGNLVMWHFHSFFKNVNIFLFVIPLSAIFLHRPQNKLLILGLFFSTSFMTHQLWESRFSEPPPRIVKDVNCGEYDFKTKVNCLRKFIWEGKKLKGLIGHIHGDLRQAQEGIDKAGYLSYGPYIDLPPGKYRFTLNYRLSNLDPLVNPKNDSTKSEIENSKWDLGFFNSDFPIELGKGILDSNEANMTLEVELKENVNGVEFRVYYGGKGTLNINSLVAEQI